MVRTNPTALRLIGYWSGPAAPDWPDPQSFIDRSWDQREREDVAGYLQQGFVFTAFGGTSKCRICGIDNGAVEFTDGTWYWPEGLAHYVTAHDVRLPQEFVDHVKAELDLMDGAARDVDWWRSQRGLNLDG